ncbi:MAG: DUF2059 domain-containing protein [Prevotella sp.]|nr:DUF2059 domain-containing protein [Prevotella sp.]
MKKSLMMLALLVAFCTGGRAQTISEEYKAEVMRAMNLQRTNEIFKETMRLQMMTLVNQGTLSYNSLDNIVDEVANVVVPALMERQAEIYNQYFTLDELRQLNAYLSSPIGQKMVQMTPVLSTEGAAVTQRPEIVQRIQAIVARYIGQ